MSESQTATISGPVMKDRRVEPRTRRLGGIVLSRETAKAWASSVYGEGLDPISSFPRIEGFLNKKFKEHRIKSRLVGEELDKSEYMMITHVAKFNGYKDMDPKEIPQFEENTLDAFVREVLEREGIKDYVFKTRLF